MANMNRDYISDMIARNTIQHAVIALDRLQEHDQVHGTLLDDALALRARLSEQAAHIMAVWD